MERENPAKPPERDSDEVVTINILLKDTLKVMEDNHMMIEMFGDKMKSFSSFDFKGIPGIGSLNESVNKIMDMQARRNRGAGGLQPPNNLLVFVP